MNEHLLVGYDGSTAADKAFAHALVLAEAFNAKLTVLAVVQPPEPPEDVETEAMLESGQERFGKLFTSLRARAGAEGVNAIFDVAVGHPAEQILYRADDIGATHIVLGHRGKNTFKRWLMGSVSQRVIAYAKCSVTVVR